MCSPRGYCIATATQKPVAREPGQEKNRSSARSYLESLGAEASLKHLEELIEHSRLAQPLPEECDCSVIWNAVHHTKPYKFLKGASIIDLEFKLVIIEFEKLIKNEHLEKDQCINPFAPCIALAIMLIAIEKKWAK